MGKMATDEEKGNAGTLPNRKKTGVTARNAVLIAVIASSAMLAQLVGGISCLPSNPEYHPLIAAAQEDVYGHMNRLVEAHKPEKPSPLAPLEVDLDAVESQTTTMGISRTTGVGIDSVGLISVGGGGGGGGG